MKNSMVVLVWVLVISLHTAIGAYQTSQSSKSSLEGAQIGQASKKPQADSVEESQIAKGPTGEPEISKNAPQKSSVGILPLGSITKAMVGQIATIVGEVVNKNKTAQGHLIIQVADRTGQIRVIIFADKSGDENIVELGQMLKIVGKVIEYQGSLEIVPRNAKDVSVWKSASRLLSKEDIGSTVTIRGKIASEYNHPGGYVFLSLLMDGTGQEIKIPLFEPVASEHRSLRVNSDVSVKGKLAEYKGAMQIVPETTNDLIVLKEGDEEDVKLVKISNIIESSRGRMVQVRGYVEDISGSGGHTFFALKDDSGKAIKAVLFRADAQEISGRKAKIVEAAAKRSPVRVLAVVDIYNNELELIVDKVFDKY